MLTWRSIRTRIQPITHNIWLRCQKKLPYIFEHEKYEYCFTPNYSYNILTLFHSYLLYKVTRGLTTNRTTFISIGQGKAASYCVSVRVSNCKSSLSCVNSLWKKYGLSSAYLKDFEVEQERPSLPHGLVLVHPYRL